MTPTVTDLVARLEQGFDADTAQRLADGLLETHGIRITWTTARPPAASRRGRRIFCPPIQTEIDLATFLHELGHHLAEPCAGPLHRCDPHATTANCVRCETLAWQHAMAIVPFSRAMFADLRTCLGSYLGSTAAPADARAAARQLASDGTFARTVQARAERERRLDAYREMQGWAAEPAVRTKRERQIDDMRRWAAEDRR
jgi:hypothetical protein